MEDYMSFKKMITPIIIQIVFWLAVVVVLIAGLILIVQGEQRLAGLALIIVGPFVVRIYAELLMLMFRINETLTEVSNTLRQIQNNTKPPSA
jgi:ABC-type multidrug transport system fused ATPase/permease subunit